MKLASAMGALLLVVGGCNADLGDGPGAGGDQASPPDALETPDARVSEPSIDAAPVPDAAPATPDASPAALCTQGYAEVPGFQLCTSTPTDCTFIALNGDTTCADHCAAHQGTCLSALDNEVGDCVNLEADQTGIGCTTTGKTDLLCRCTIP